MAASKDVISGLTGKPASEILTLSETLEKSRAVDEPLNVEVIDPRIIDTLTKLSDPIFIISEKSGLILYMNDSAKDKIGVMFLGRHFTELIPHKYREAHKDLYKTFTRTRFFPLEAGSITPQIKLEHRIPMLLQLDPLKPPVMVSVEAHVSKISQGYSCHIIEKAEMVNALKDTADRQRILAHEGRNVRMAAIHTLEASMIALKREMSELSAILSSLDPSSLLYIKLDKVLSGLKESYKSQYVALCSEKYVDVIENYLLSPNHQEDFSIIKATNTMVDLFANECGGKITLIKQGMLNETSQCVVNGSKSVMLYALANVLKNAIKFTEHAPKEKKEITVSLEMDIKGIQLSVTDTGIGMTPEQCSQCLAGGENKFNSSIKGNGSGLSHLHASMRKINSQICVESEFGKGTTFTMFFPFKLVHKHDSNISYDHIRVLVVDDNRISCIVLRQMLIGIGFKESNVVTSNSRENSEHLFRSNYVAGAPFHLVLTDFNMPSSADCFELMQSIRTFESGMVNGIPVKVVIFSGDVINLDEQDSDPRLRLANYSLVKSCGKDKLMLTLIPYVKEVNAAISARSRLSLDIRDPDDHDFSTAAASLVKPRGNMYI